MTNYKMSYIANYAAVSKPQSKWRYLQMQACTAHCQEAGGGGCILVMKAPGKLSYGLLESGCHARNHLLLA